MPGTEQEASSTCWKWATSPRPAIAPMSQTTSLRVDNWVVPTYNRRPFRCSAATAVRNGSSMTVPISFLSGVLTARASENGIITHDRVV